MKTGEGGKKSNREDMIEIYGRFITRLLYHVTHDFKFLAYLPLPPVRPLPSKRVQGCVAVMGVQGCSTTCTTEGGNGQLSKPSTGWRSSTGGHFLPIGPLLKKLINKKEKGYQEIRPHLAWKALF